METMRVIRVTGKGQIKVKPDMTRITLELEGTYPEYNETLRRSAENTEQLKDVLFPFGFERSDLKTLYFDVDTEYESYWENDEHKRKFIGYKFEHRLKLEFDSDNERLGKILYALANSDVKPEFRISYTIKNEESAKNELLGKAVTDAKEKAAVLSKAAGVTIKDIQSIDYSWGKIDFEVNPMSKALLSEDCLMSEISSNQYNLDIEPDNIEVSDTVTVVWEIQ